VLIENKFALNRSVKKLGSGLYFFKFRSANKLAPKYIVYSVPFI